VTEEYPRLLDYVAGKVGIPTKDVRDLVHLDFPHTAALLDGVPFSASVADAWRLVDYLASTSHVTTEQMCATLQAKFPKTYQIFTNLKLVTDGWAQAPGTVGLTRFDGSPARSVPLIRDYFRFDVIPGLERQQKDYVIVDTNFPPLTVFAPLLTAVGVFVVGYGVMLGRLTRNQRRRQQEAVGVAELVPEEPIPVDVR
jgi:hypothetical protein